MQPSCASAWLRACRSTLQGILGRKLAGMIYGRTNRFLNAALALADGGMLAQRHIRLAHELAGRPVPDGPHDWPADYPSRRELALDNMVQLYCEGALAMGYIVMDNRPLPVPLMLDDAVSPAVR